MVPFFLGGGQVMSNFAFAENTTRKWRSSIDIVSRLWSVVPSNRPYKTTNVMH